MKNSYSKLYDAQSTPFEISQNSIKSLPTTIGYFYFEITKKVITCMLSVS